MSWESKTPRRRNSGEIEALVLKAIASSRIPLSAYDIAEAASRAGAPLVPNQVYRTLARLIERGRVQRIESLNAYLLSDCTADACLICDDCHSVRMMTVPDLRSCMGALAGGSGFVLEQRVVEIHGYCAECLARAAPSRSTSSPQANEVHHAQG